MDELTELRRMWADQAEPGNERLAPARRMLLAEARAAAGPAGDRARRRPRVGWRVGLASGGVALAVSGTLFATQVVGGDTTLAAANAATVLERAADAAASEPWTNARPGQYLVVTAREIGHTPAIGPNGPFLFPAQKINMVTYLPVDSTAGTLVDTRLPHACATPPPIKGASYAAMRGWPTDPNILRGFLINRIDPKYLTQGNLDRDGELWNAITTLINARPVPPRQRAGLFRILAALAGVQLIRDTVDAAGRHGIAVSFTYPTGDLPVQRERDELIFDKTTYGLLGTASFTASAAGEIPAGTALGSRALIKTTVVNHLPAGVPAPAECRL